MPVSGNREWRVPVDSDDVTAVLERSAGGASGRIFFCAHGAGGHMADRGVLAVAAALRERGLDIVRFNFPYSEKKSRRPDPMPRLVECISAVVAMVCRDAGAQRVIIGGRSMGGRAASMLAADGFDCDALLLLAYPLHPAGQPGKLRDAHLAGIAKPVLCINGTRDALCEHDRMNAVVARLRPNWQMHWLDGADHSFHVTKASGRSDADVLTELGDTVERWCARWR